MFHLDGSCEDPRVHWAYPFDAACATADGRYAVIYQRLGTKALLLRDGRVLRELNRSFYHAHVYEYPVCIWQTLDGRTLIAHCTERYCRIDIEDAETGERLTDAIREPEDFFHSRLMVNASGTRMLSAGWVWHPWSGVVYFDVSEALRNPSHLDKVQTRAPASLNVCLAEEGSACWQTNDRVLLGGSTEEEDESLEEKEFGEPRLHARGIAVYDVVSHKYIRSVVLAETPGTMMPIGENNAVCFYEHPKVVSLDSGEVIASWDDLDTGNQTSSILGRDTRIPPLAVDAQRSRFAVHGPGGITVVQIRAGE